jgi:ABC-2 type transport system ATP-binding protein
MTTSALGDISPRQASANQWAVETHGLAKRFKDNVAVDGVELLVPRGCAFGYLGPNGAGKTTLIRVLLGLTHADAGTMSLFGYPVPHHRDRARGELAPLALDSPPPIDDPEPAVAGLLRSDAVFGLIQEYRLVA